MNKPDYDEEQVFYCNSCLSLLILNSSGVEEDIEDDPIPCYCGDCGSADIDTSTIYELLELRKERKLTNKNKYNK